LILVYIQRFALSRNPENFLKVPLCGTFKKFSVPFKASICCIQPQIKKKPCKAGLFFNLGLDRAFLFYDGMYAKISEPTF